MTDLDPFFFRNNRWSFTKHRVWNRCPRQYYFEYIAPYVKSDPVVDPGKIRWLKNFTSKFVVQGQVVHDIIDKQIQAHCDERPMSLDEALIAFSRKVAAYRTVEGITLTECHNGQNIPDSFYADMEANGQTCLFTFFGKWPEYAKRVCLRHEKFDNFTIGDVGVTVKVDFIGKMPDGTLLLTDWKTGKDDDENESEIQMAAYVLWAKDYYNLTTDEIGTELVFLKTGKTKPYNFYDEQLAELKEMIVPEFAAMNASYDFVDFPPKASQRECLSCKFATVCSISAK